MHLSQQQLRLVETGPVDLIGVVSDTHIPTRGRRLPETLWQALQGVELILHAGDLIEEKVLEELATLAPVHAVAGNMDPWPLWSRLGEKMLLQAGPVRIGLVHGHGDGGKTWERARAAFAWKDPLPDAIVFGHSHRPFNKTVGGILLFNPGSAVDPRRMARPSCGRLHLSGGGVEGEIVFL